MSYIGDKLGKIVVLTLFIPMEFFIELYTIQSGWSIVVSIEGSQAVILKRKLYFFLCRSILSQQTVHYVAFHLGLHCVPNYPFRGFWSTKGRQIGM